MSGSKRIEYHEKKIVFMDLSNADYKQCIEALGQAESLIRNQPNGSVLGLLDVTGSPFNRDVTNALKEFASANRPFMKMTVVVGIEGMKRVLLDTVIMLARRNNIVISNSIDEAKELLAGLR